MTIILISLLVLAIVLAAIGFIMAGVVMSIRRQTLEEARIWQEDHYDLSWYDPIGKTDYTVRSYDGYTLHVQLLHNDLPDSSESGGAGGQHSGKYVIISHGYTDNRFGALKYARIYLDMGFNVIVYDLRGHGKNEPTFCTYSARERLDLKALIEDTRARYKDLGVLGLHGESLGAATSVAVLEFSPAVDFVVADCGFSEIESVIRGGARSVHVPGGITKLISPAAKMRFGYSFNDMRPVDSLPGNTVPILFIHGADDDFIVPGHSEKNHSATDGYAESHQIPGASHAMSVLTDPVTYGKYVRDFLDTININYQ